MFSAAWLWTRVSALQTESSEVDKYAIAMARGQILAQGVFECRFGQFRAPERHVAGASLLGQPRTVDYEPASVMRSPCQRANLIRLVERPLVGGQLAKICENFRLDCATPAPR